jgi:hypothetical protein
VRHPVCLYFPHILVLSLFMLGKDGTVRKLCWGSGGLSEHGALGHHSGHSRLCVLLSLPQPDPPVSLLFLGALMLLCLAKVTWPATQVECLKMTSCFGFPGNLSHLCYSETMLLSPQVHVEKLIT